MLKTREEPGESIDELRERIFPVRAVGCESLLGKKRAEVTQEVSKNAQAGRVRNRISR